MKKIIFLFTLVVFVYSALFSQQPIKTIEKKEYYDIFKTKIESITHVTADGKFHGECKGFYESGVLKDKAIWYLGVCIQESHNFETGQLNWIYNKNKSGDFHGEQKIYKIVDGMPKLQKYAKLNNGKVIEFSYDDGYGKFTLKDNIYKYYDDNNKVSFKIENGKINGTLGLNPSNEEYYKLCLWGCNHFIQFADNKLIKYVGEDYDKTFEYNYNFDKKNFTYTEKNKKNDEVIKGFWKPQENFVNNIKLINYIYVENDYALPKFLAFEFNYKDYALDIPSYCKKDSIWSRFKNDKLLKETTYKNGEWTYYKEFDKNGKLFSDIDRESEARLSDILMKAEMSFYRTIFYELKELVQSMANVNKVDYEKWDSFRKTSYHNIGISENNSHYLIYYNVECKSPEKKTIAICDSDIDNINRLQESLESNFNKNWDLANLNKDKEILTDEIINIYNNFTNAIKKIGIKEMNTKCKGLTTKEDLVKLLETIK